MTMPTPTQAEYAAADTIVHLLGSDPAYARERIAQLIATERAMVDLTISQNQMTTDSARPHVVADPAQAHAQELENFLVFFRSILYEFRKRTPNRWSPTAERKYSEMDALLSTLERERKAQKGTT